jgi:galactokinase
LFVDRGAGRPGAGEMAQAHWLGARFTALFGETPRLYRSPGRVNLIGEHTDYNEGFVLPAALALSCRVAAAARGDGRLIVRSENMDDAIEADLENDPPSPSADPVGRHPVGRHPVGRHPVGRHWSDYVVGVAAILRRSGHAIRGATLLIHSDVPPGAGLSSSAALEVGVATALLDLAGATAEPADVARMCQRAEHEFAGARCGIMDQFVACHAREATALMLDCRSLQYHFVPMPPPLRIVVCNTKVRHSVSGGEYNRRVAECEAGVAVLAHARPGLRSLRDADAATLEACRRDLPDTIFHRCRHVVTENERVHRMASALERHDLGALGPLMAESHRSLRDDYDVSSPELDLLVEIADEVPGVFGSRMTGAGFGGCTVNLVHAESVEEFGRRISGAYEARTGIRPDVFVTHAAAAAGRIA